MSVSLFVQAGRTMDGNTTNGPALLFNPYPIYDEWRAEGRVVLFAESDVWMVTGYREVADLLRHPGLLADRPGLYFAHMEPTVRAELSTLERLLKAMMLFADPPRHTRLRGLVSRGFTPRVVDMLTERVRTVVDEHLDAIAATGRMEVMEDLAIPLPIIVIAELLGVPRADRVQLKTWSYDFATFIGQGRPDLEIAYRANAGLEAARAYLLDIVNTRRALPGEDLLSTLLAAEDRGDVLSDDELFATAILVLVAGHETTTNLIGNGLLALLTNPDQRRRFQNEPDLTGPAIEEMLRFDSPVQATSRMVGADLKWQGHQFRKGQFVDLMLAAANRDPERFDRPSAFTIDRPDNRHLAFGFGPHFCVGAPLARLEGRLALRTMFDRFPDVRLDPGVTALEHHPSPTFRSLISLPVTFTATGR